MAPGHGECTPTPILTPETPLALKRLLEVHGVDFSNWGSGATKSLEALAGELKGGESRLQIDEGGLTRVVSVVGVDVLFEDREHGVLRLVEAEQRFTGGSVRQRQLRTSLGEKQLPGESPLAAAKRAIEEALGLPARTLQFKQLRSETDEGPSSSYPGLRSLRHLTYFECLLPAPLFDSMGYEECQLDKVTSFTWCQAS